jgi:hypothetical protein
MMNIEELPFDIKDYIISSLIDCRFTSARMHSGTQHITVNRECDIDNILTLIQLADVSKEMRRLVISKLGFLGTHIHIRYQYEDAIEITFNNSRGEYMIEHITLNYINHPRPMSQLSYIKSVELCGTYPRDITPLANIETLKIDFRETNLVYKLCTTTLVSSTDILCPHKFMNKHIDLVYCIIEAGDCLTDIQGSVMLCNSQILDMTQRFTCNDIMLSFAHIPRIDILFDVRRMVVIDYVDIDHEITYTDDSFSCQILQWDGTDYPVNNIINRCEELSLSGDVLCISLSRAKASRLTISDDSHTTIHHSMTNLQSLRVGYTWLCNNNVNVPDLHVWGGKHLNMITFSSRLNRLTLTVDSTSIDVSPLIYAVNLKTLRIFGCKKITYLTQLIQIEELICGFINSIPEDKIQTITDAMTLMTTGKLKDIHITEHDNIDDVYSPFMSSSVHEDAFQYKHLYWDIGNITV